MLPPLESIKIHVLLSIFSTDWYLQNLLLLHEITLKEICTIALLLLMSQVYSAESMTVISVVIIIRVE